MHDGVYDVYETKALAPPAAALKEARKAREVRNEGGDHAMRFSTSVYLTFFITPLAQFDLPDSKRTFLHHQKWATIIS